MAGYKKDDGTPLPTDQLESFKKSVHGKALLEKGDLGAPACNSCHGNHGAAPPGLSWVGNVCGQCHSVMADLYTRSVHATVFAQMGAPGCATCHQNHAIEAASDERLGTGVKGVCAACHTAEDPGGKAAAEMRRQIDALVGEHARAGAILARAEQSGMEVSQAQFDLEGARSALVKARAAVHAFTPEAVKRETEPGLAIGSKAYARGVRALEELAFRRKGLAVSVVIILALIGGLVLKIRQLEGGRPVPGSGGGERSDVL